MPVTQASLCHDAQDCRLWAICINRVSARIYPGLRFITDTLHAYTLHIDNWDAVRIVTRTRDLTLKNTAYCVLQARITYWVTLDRSCGNALCSSRCISYNQTAVQCTAFMAWAAQTVYLCWTSSETETSGFPAETTWVHAWVAFSRAFESVTYSLAHHELESVSIVIIVIIWMCDLSPSGPTEDLNLCVECL